MARPRKHLEARRHPSSRIGAAKQRRRKRKPPHRPRRRLLVPERVAAASGDNGVAARGDGRAGGGRAVGGAGVASQLSRGAAGSIRRRSASHPRPQGRHHHQSASRIIIIKTPSACNQASYMRSEKGKHRRALATATPNAYLARNRGNISSRMRRLCCGN